jgi:hypothetical protein
MAFLMQKGRPDQRYEWATLVGGAIAALSTLRSDASDDGWRAMIDRAGQR